VNANNPTRVAPPGTDIRGVQDIEDEPWRYHDELCLLSLESNWRTVGHASVAPAGYAVKRCQCLMNVKPSSLAYSRNQMKTLTAELRNPKFIFGLRQRERVAEMVDATVEALARAYDREDHSRMKYESERRPISSEEQRALAYITRWAEGMPMDAPIYPALQMVLRMATAVLPENRGDGS
jgi:hypothetical protein